MKIQGVDPVVMNRIQEKVSKKSVQETKQTLIYSEQERRGRKKKQEKLEIHDLQLFVNRLNKAVTELNISLFFKVGEGEPAMVLVIDKATNRVLSEISSEKAAGMLAEIDNLVGVIVDSVQ